MKGRAPPQLAAAGRWPPLAAVVGLLALAALLPERYGLLPPCLRYPLWALVGVLVAASTWAHVSHAGHRFERAAVTAALLVTTAVMVFALGRVIALVLRQGANVAGLPLLSTGVTFWVTNVVVFGLWYWLLDRGGPGKRAAGSSERADLLFPQAQLGAGWAPCFVDYLFVAFTASVAFSPTDTAPISARAKLLMMAQSLIALVTLAVVVGRAVNLLQ